MSVLLTVGLKCTLAASQLPPDRVTVSMPTKQTHADRRTDAPDRYITLSDMDSASVTIYYYRATPCHRVSVRPSVTRRYCIKTAKSRITQTTPGNFCIIFACRLL